MDSNPNNAFTSQTLPPLLAQQQRVEELLSAANVARWAELHAPTPWQQRAAKLEADRALAKAKAEAER